MLPRKRDIDSPHPHTIAVHMQRISERHPIPINSYPAKTKPPPRVVVVIILPTIPIRPEPAKPSRPPTATPRPVAGRGIERRVPRARDVWFPRGSCGRGQ